MRITNEADYALRFILVLSDGSQKSAKIISEETGVTLRFALKILRKLSLAEIVGSQQGATGGYFLKRSPSAVSLGEIIEIIDGPIQINDCIDDEYICSRMGTDTEDCRIHQFFIKLNEDIRQRLYTATLDQFFQA